MSFPLSSAKPAAPVPPEVPRTQLSHPALTAVTPPNLAAVPRERERRPAGSAPAPEAVTQPAERPCRYRFWHLGSGRKRFGQASFHTGVCGALWARYGTRRRLGHCSAKRTQLSGRQEARAAMRAPLWQPQLDASHHIGAAVAPPAARPLTRLPAARSPPPSQAARGRRRSTPEAPHRATRDRSRPPAVPCSRCARTWRRGPGKWARSRSNTSRSSWQRAPIRRPRRKRSISWPEAAGRGPHGAPWWPQGANAAAKWSPRGAVAELWRGAGAPCCVHRARAARKAGKAQTLCAGRT